MKKGFVTFVVSILVLVVLCGCGVDNSVSPLPTPPAPLPPGEVVDPAEIPTLPGFLEMLAGPTGWLVLGAALSAAFAQWTWYNAQPDVLKRGLILAVSALLAISARLLLTYMPMTFWEQIAPYWFIVAGVVLTWLGSQGWFLGVVKPARTSMAKK